MPRAVIHIGANKTGSTTLQRWLFAKSEEVVYLGEDCVGYETYRDKLNSLVSDDDIHFQDKEVRGIVERLSASLGDKTLVYSNEDIMTSRVPTLCAKRLHELLPGAVILVVIRNQLSAIPSWYVNHGAYLRNVPRKYWRRYVPFNDWMDYCTAFMKYSPLDGYFYHRILRLYAGLFGKENIQVLFYEDFVNDLRGFTRKLCRVLRIEEEQALKMLREKRERRRNTTREFAYHKFRSWFFPGRSLSAVIPGSAVTRLRSGFLSKGAPMDGFMDDYWRNRIAELYKEDNDRLARDFDLPLEAHGYPLP